EDELNRMRTALDESNHYREQQQEIVAQLEMKLTNESKNQQSRRTVDVLNVDGGNVTFPDRTKSAPHFGGVYRKDTSLIQPRTIHSSPAAFDMEYVVERFHGRSIALAHSQEEFEELDLRDDKQQKEDKKFVRRGTYRVRKSRNTPSVLDYDFQGDALQSLTQASITKQKLIEESNRKVKEGESKIQDLSINIQLKEQLIKSVYASNKDVKDTNEQYEQHIKMLEKEVERANQEYNDLQKTMQQIAVKGTTEKSKLESEYRKKCDMAKERLESLKKKEKHYRELMIKLNGNSEKRIADLQSALFRMKQQHETAQKRVKEEIDLKNKVEQELIREQQRIQELTIQNEQQQKILKLKTEGLVAAQRRLRSAQGAGNGSDQQQSPTLNFDQEMEKLVFERKELNTLKEELEKREELIRKKETLINEQIELEKKKMRTSQVLNKSLKTMNEKLDNVDKQIHQSVNLRDKEKQSSHLLMKEQLLKQKHLFNERLENNNILTPNEERRLIEINEAIEAVDLAVEYQNNIISRKEKEIQQSIRASQGLESPLFKINHLSESESKELCRQLFEKVIDLKDNDQKSQREFDEMKSQLDEQTQIILELKSRINQETIEYDRKLTCIQQINEEEKHLLLKQLNDTSIQIKELEKDLYFYKHKTRELRKSMATLTNSATTIQDSLNTSFRQQINQNVAP
ncbi:unnamed protein product, partial [Didymodactylos carnosus]